jgi:hypothetical protein
LVADGVVVTLAVIVLGGNNMCIICVGINNKTLLPWEALRNSDEMWDVIPDDHKEELDEKIALFIREWMEQNPTKKPTL